MDDLIERIAGIQKAVVRRLAAMDIVGAIWIADDVAYHTGTVMPPAWLKEKIFRHYAEMGKILREAGKLFIYHSDGDIRSLIDIIAECGFTSLHPIEPESMEIGEVRTRAGRRLSLIGNIRVHTLSTGSPEEIRRLCRDRIEKFGYEGGYALGSSNSVPNYVPLRNYRAMLETNAKYGRIP